MTKQSILRLTFLCETIPALLHKIPNEEFTFKLHPEKWSKLEILGHLIDSATNNHQRFIRSQFENNPTIIYDQDNWNKFNNYKYLLKDHLIKFWKLYNEHLLEVIKAIPEENLLRSCITNEDSPVTLGWLIDDYVVHLEHHLHQIVKYEQVSIL